MDFLIKKGNNLCFEKILSLNLVSPIQEQGIKNNQRQRIKEGLFLTWMSLYIFSHLKLPVTVSSMMLVSLVIPLPQATTVFLYGRN